jgi:hypothetical protein
MKKIKIWIVAVVAIIVSVGLILIACDFFSDENENCHGEKACIHTWKLINPGSNSSIVTDKYDSCGYDLCAVSKSAGEVASSVYRVESCNCKP